MEPRRDGTPWGYEKPERRAKRARSHFCDRLGAEIYCDQDECPFCGDEGEDSNA